MTENHSNLQALKIVAECAGLPWSEGQKVYAALQDANLLPKSAGRKVWYAHPNLVADFLIALANKFTDPAKSCGFYGLTKKAGADFRDDHLRFALGKLLQAPATDTDVAAVEFLPDRQEAIIRFENGDEITFVADGQKPAPGPQPDIFFKGVIRGDLFRKIRQRKIRWQLHGSPTGETQESET